MKIRYSLVVIGLVSIQFGLATPASAQSRDERTVNSASTVLEEIMAIPNKQIPQSLLKGARGVAIVPGMLKGGFVIGVRRGRGVLLTRDEANNWYAPTFVTVTGGSVGYQIGVEATDLILVFNTQESIDGIDDKLTLGVDAAAAAGPVGRRASAATDLAMKAEVLSYSRSRGLFAGVTVEGSVLHINYAAHQEYYRGSPTPPASAVRLVTLLSQYSGTTIPDPEAVRVRSFPGQDAFQTPAAQTPVTVVKPLRDASVKLQALLDSHWKSHLALPAGIYDSNKPVDRAVWKRSLKNYDSVARDPQFANLTQREEFKTTHRLLREYVRRQTKPVAGGALNLPPPPSGSRSPVIVLPSPRN